MTTPYYIYHKAENKIYADWPEPIIIDYLALDPKYNRGDCFIKDMQYYNSRPSYDVKPKPDWENGKRVQQDIDFTMSFKCDRWCAECKAFDWSVCERKYIAIPLPKEAEKVWDSEDFIQPRNEQQDIPMEKEKKYMSEGMNFINDNVEMESDMYDEAMFDVIAEVRRAKTLFKENFHNQHEGYAVILEELDELWDEVKKNQKRYDIPAQRKEAIQCAAMCIRFIAELTPQSPKEEKES